MKMKCFYFASFIYVNFSFLIFHIEFRQEKHENEKKRRYEELRIRTKCAHRMKQYSETEKKYRQN